MTIQDNPGLLFWARTSETDQTEARDMLTGIISDNAEFLVSRFYSTFLTHPEASAFLSHSVVSERLSHSLHNWLLDLIQFNPQGDATEFDERQVQIGEVHARLKIPNHLVMEGMTLLKTEISVKISELGLDAAKTMQVIVLLGEIIDYAMRQMTAAYLVDTTRRVQTDEAFRLFSLGQDINLERETQRAALMEWSQSVLFALLGHGNNTAAAPLSSSPFGLWVRHRAAVLFQGASYLERIEDLMRVIDGEVLSLVAENQPSAVVELHRRIDEMKFLLSELFQAAGTMENGRDPLTRALNRRFLPSVLGREITLAKTGHIPLSVLMVDIDHFKAVNDAHGHSTGDLVLGRTAEILLASIRKSDFVFRYGGEEFLIVLVETTKKDAGKIAEHIRQTVQNSPISLPDGSGISITLSIGVAEYEGHPDYQYMINAADKALYSAKKSGRNRIALTG